MDLPPGPPGGSGSGDEPGASRHRRGDVGFDRWLKAKLHHTYDAVLEEEVPADLLALLQAFDSAEKEGEERDRERGGSSQASGRPRK